MSAIVDPVEDSRCRDGEEQRILGERFGREALRSEQPTRTEQWQQVGGDSVRRRVDVVELDRDRRRRQLWNADDGRRVEDDPQCRAIDVRDNRVGWRARVREGVPDRIESENDARIEGVTARRKQQWSFLADLWETWETRIDGDRFDRRVLERDARLRAQNRTRRAGFQLLLAGDKRDGGGETAQD